MALQKKYSNDFNALWLRSLETHLDSFFGQTDKRSDCESLYFGGGTPSLLDSSSLWHLRQILEKHYELGDLSEWTLEANPEDITAEKLSLWKELGISRLSLGVQSFQGEELRRLERLATEKKLGEAIELIKKQFENFSIDLMFGIPSQNLEGLEANLLRVLDYAPAHISIYLLTIAPDHKWNQSKKMSSMIPGEDQVVQMYRRICQCFSEAGYHHYELSNFAKPGFASSHNQRYWNPKKSYLGLGPGAHGYDAQQAIRYENIRDLKVWAEDPKGVGNQEELTEEQQMLEDFYLHLRTRKDFPVERIDKQMLLQLEEKGWIERNDSGSHFRVAEESWILLDAICNALVAKLH